MASWVSSPSSYNRCKQFFCIVLIREIKDDDDDNDRKEILGSFVTKEKIIFNGRPKKKPYTSDQVKRQIKYQSWHVDKYTRPCNSLFIFPWGIYKAAAFLIPVSSGSLVCMNYYTFIYGLAYRCFEEKRGFADCECFTLKEKELNLNHRIN